VRTAVAIFARGKAWRQRVEDSASTEYCSPFPIRSEPAQHEPHSAERDERLFERQAREVAASNTTRAAARAVPRWTIAGFRP